MPTLSIYVDRETYRKVQEAAEREYDGNESKVFQKAITFWFKQQDQKIFNIPNNKWVNLSDEEQKKAIEKFYNNYYKNRDDCYEQPDKM